VEAISGQLPNNSRMLNLSVDDTGSLSGNFEFAGISDAAEYMLGLQRNLLVSAIAVKGITRIDKIVNPPSKPSDTKTTATKSTGTGTTNPPVGNGMPTPSNPESPAADPIDEMIKLMEQGLVQGKSEGDKLLNQLTWMVNEQLVKEKFGVDIKDETALNALKAKQAANKQQTAAAAASPSLILPGSLPSGNSSAANASAGSIAAGSGSASGSNTMVTVYQVALTFTLKPPGQVK
jgi:hypothetical protein